MNFIDLFAGIGGFRLGMERAGHKCVAFCEIDKYARQTYMANFDITAETNWQDITKVTDEEISEFGKRNKVDAICGGFPCQAFSIAGKREGFEDIRGTMFFEIVRFIRVLKPKYLFFENVRGLLSHRKGQAFRAILQTLDELRYDVQWQLLNSKDFGVPQSRQRLFIIGYRRGECTRKVLPIKSPNGQNTNELTEITTGKAQAYRVYRPSGLSTTLKALGGGLGAKTGLYAFIDLGSIRVRKLTPLECFRLQGFPDEFYYKARKIGISDCQLYRQAGNAVTVNVIYEIAKKLGSEECGRD